jgi:hypothetical protein
MINTPTLTLLDNHSHDGPFMYLRYAPRPIQAYYLNR